MFVLAGALACAALLGGCSSSSSLGPLPAKRARTAGSLFAVDTTRAVGDGPWSLAIADFDTSGTPDVAVACMGSRTISILANGPDGGIMHNVNGLRDTVLLVDSLAFDSTVASKGELDTYFPRVIRAADVNADGLPDLVLSLMDLDTLEVTPDRLMILLNQGTGNAVRHIVAYDTLAGRDVRDLFVGGLLGGSGGLSIVTAPSSDLTPPLLLGRAARSASGEINLIGTQPERDAEGASLFSDILIWFDQGAGAVDQFQDQEVVLVTGHCEDDEGDGEVIDIESVVQQSVTTDGRTYTRYVLTPARQFRPLETVTVSILDSLVGTAGRTYEGYASWSFTTGGIGVRSTNPADGAVGIGTGTRFHVTFGWNIEGFADDAAYRKCFLFTSGSGAVITPHFELGEDGRTVTITPADSLNPYDEITLAVNPNPPNGVAMTDTLGRAILMGDTLFYRVSGPKVLTTWPPADTLVSAEDLDAAGRTISAELNCWVDNSFAGDEVTVVGDLSGTHALTSLASPPRIRHRIEAQVSGGFVPGEWVTVTATTRIRSEYEHYPLARPHVWRFMIRPEAEIVEVPTAPGFSISGGSLAAGRWTDTDDGFGVLFADTAGMFHALLRRSDGWSYEGVALLTDDGQYVVRQGDLNGDGLSDVIAARSDSIYCVVFMNTSTGSELSFAEPQVYEVGDEPVDLFIGDLNGDGYVDVATANLISNDVSVLLNDGSGVLSTETYFPVGAYPRAIAGADLDGDGDVDLVVANSIGNSLTFLKNVTPTSTAPPE